MQWPSVLRRLFDVRAGEREHVLGAGAAIFLLVAGHTMLETARDALFLQRLLPARLPLVYALIAALSLALAPIGSALARGFGRRNGLVASVLAAAYGTALFDLMPLRAGSVFALYTWSGLLGTLLLLQFWLFASELFTVAQGKRLFGLIAAGGALGAVASSALSIALVNLVSVRSLLLSAAGLFIAAAMVLTRIRVEQEAPAAARAIEATGVSRPALGAVISDRYVLRLAGLSSLGAAALLVLDYLFKSSAAHNIAPARLAAFFALYYAALNAASLLMQVFASGPLIRRLGVVPALGLLPALLLVIGGGTLIAGVPFAMVLVLKGCDGALRYSTHRVANELVQMPLSPSLHEQVKGLIDGPLQRVWQAITASLLLFIASRSSGDGVAIALVLVVLCAAWLVLAVGLRRPYVQRFREALTRPSALRQLIVDELDADAIEAVLEALSSRDPSRVISAMELLADKRRVRLIPALVLYHEDETVLASALSILGNSDREDWLDHAERLLGHGSEAVRLGTLRALSLRGRHQALERALADSSVAVRAHASFWLVSRDGAANPLSDPRIAALLAADGQSAIDGQIALLSAICDAPDAAWIPVLFELARSSDARVVEAAARAMVALPDARFIPLLIPRLAMQDGRAAVRDALSAHGEAALSALHQAFEERATEERVRQQLPRAIAGFATQRAADVLLRQLGAAHSGLVRYRVLRALLKLATETRVRVAHEPIEQQVALNLRESLRVLGLQLGLSSQPATARAARSRRLVLGLLEAKREQALERVFHLLQIRHRNENIRRVHYALRSDDRRTRAYALEFLDTLSSARGSGEAAQQVRELLRIVADDLTPAERLQRAAHLIGPVPRDHADALRALMADADEHLAAFAAYHALELGSVELTREVARAVRERPALNRIDRDQPLFPLPVLAGGAS